LPHLRRSVCVDLLMSDGRSVWLEALFWVEKGYAGVPGGATRSFLPSCKVTVWSCVTSRAIGCFSRVVDVLNRYNVSDISMNDR
jgi:hypothetical protein